MSLTKREKVLAAATAFVLAFGLVGTQARSRVEAIRTKSANASALSDRIRMQRELIGAAADWAARYEAVKDQMPVFEHGKQVDTYWLSIMDLAAEQYGVKIRNRSAKQETVMSDVCEFPIEVREWEATLEAFIRFVHAIQSEGAMLDMREMRVAPLPNRPGILKGSFVLYCAYMRGTPTASAEATPPPAEPVPVAPTPEPAAESAPSAEPPSPTPETSPGWTPPVLSSTEAEVPAEATKAAPGATPGSDTAEPLISSNTPSEGVTQEPAK
ncbi:MAG: hypothetical protein ACOX9C_10705 [Kiritimatiellia bacterium]|jgi:hypothetical protein